MLIICLSCVVIGMLIAIGAFTAGIRNFATFFKGWSNGSVRMNELFSTHIGAMIVMVIGGFISAIGGIGVLIWFGMRLLEKVG